MLKILFCCLLAANGLLFAFNQGYLDTLMPSGHEPARAANQLNANKIKLLSPAAAHTSAVAPAPVAIVAPELVSVSADKKQERPACTEIGNFNIAEAKRFETQLAALSVGKTLSRREIQEVSSHMIFIPPQGGKDGADRKAGELRSLGVTDFYVIQDSSSQRWGISLGIFKTEEAARAHLASLNQKGIRSARLIEHRVPLNRIAFQLRDPDAKTKAGIDKIKIDFPRQEVRNCA
ncbi:MAG: hypothetical protein JWQ21_135 [Herminiimonas sp.]|nr:hypothetical protein [Herminiimonas sp.]